MDGHFSVHRHIWKSEHFADDPFTPREAFIWMISEAYWKDGSKQIKGRPVTIKRGQFSHSVRFMADAWGWSKSKVSRFLMRLETETAIRTEHGTGQLIVTLCNYEFYQPNHKEKGTETGTGFGTAAGQQRDKLEEGNKLKNKKEKIQKKKTDFDRFWDECPKKVEKIAAGKAFEKAVKTTNAEEIINGMKRHSAYWRRKGTEEQYIKNPATWLNKGCWMDELEGEQPSEPDSENPYTRMKRELLAQQENERSNVVKIG